MIIKQKKKNQVINKKRVMYHVLLVMYHVLLVMYHVLLVMYHVLFSHVCKPSGLWLSHLKSPKYYKVFINKKKYKARESVRFVFIYSKHKQQIKRKIKGKFLTKFPKFIFISKPPFLFEKIPKVQKRAKRKLNEVFKFLITHFNIKRKINRSSHC